MYTFVGHIKTALNSYKLANQALSIVNPADIPWIHELLKRTLNESSCPEYRKNSLLNRKHQFWSDLVWGPRCLENPISGVWFSNRVFKRKQRHSDWRQTVSDVLMIFRSKVSPYLTVSISFSFFSCLNNVIAKRSNNRPIFLTRPINK